MELKRQKQVWQAVATMLAVGIVSTGTLLIKTRYFPAVPQSLPPKDAATVTPALLLPDKPSIVVLPFKNWYIVMKRYLIFILPYDTQDL